MVSLVKKIFVNIAEGISTLLFEINYTKRDLDLLPRAERGKENWIFSLYDYSNSKTRKLIRYIKKYRDPKLAKMIARKMYSFIYDYLSEEKQLSYFENPLIIPVPISKKRRKKRGFNQNELVAKEFSIHVNGEYKDIVFLTKEIKKQALIQKRNERFKNVKGVYQLKKKDEQHVKNRDIILIDDLTTSGATLIEIQKILKRKRARKIIALTIAH